MFEFYTQVHKYKAIFVSKHISLEIYKYFVIIIKESEKAMKRLILNTFLFLFLLNLVVTDYSLQEDKAEDQKNEFNYLIEEQELYNCGWNKE